ncbi:MAG: hypothetical protein Kow00109_13550 [Acidobacteriota bacterium]
MTGLLIKELLFRGVIQKILIITLGGLTKQWAEEELQEKSGLSRLLVQIGGDMDNAMEVARGHGIFVVEGSKCRPALLADRASRRGPGMDPSPPLIDALHRAMLLWKKENRGELVGYLGERSLLEEGPFWKLSQALFELLPRDLENWKLANALLGERDTVRVEGKRSAFEKDQIRLL